MADQIQYDLDDDTQELLEQVFNWAQELVDLQKGDDVHEDMMSVILECADRFCIPRNTIYIEESEDGDGTVNLKIQVVEDDAKTKPKLTVVADNDDVDKKVLALKDWRKDDDDPIH